MKVLYAIQTTGNGHLSRAKELIPHFERRFQVDLILSGPKTGMAFDLKPIKHYHGLTLFYTQNGKIDWLKCLLKNNLLRFIIELFRVPVRKYDLVINDYEPLTAWSCKIHKIPCFGLSNQWALWQKDYPERNSKNAWHLDLIKYLAPADHGYGFHYTIFSKKIYYPIIKKEIRDLRVSSGGGFLVYLPAYRLSEIKKVLQRFPDITFTVFSKEISNPFSHNKHHYQPIDTATFTSKLAAADGVISSAGFGTTSECLFLNKPLLVIPMKRHIEQTQNAHSLQRIGVRVFDEFSLQHVEAIQNWLYQPQAVSLPFENNLNKLVDQIALDYIKIKYNLESIKKGTNIFDQKEKELITSN